MFIILMDTPKKVEYYVINQVKGIELILSQLADDRHHAGGSS